MKVYIGMAAPHAKVMTSKLVVCLLMLPMAAVAGCATETATGADPADVAGTADIAATASTRPARHCVVAPSGVTTCYGTFTEAIAIATGGEISDAPADPKAVLDDPRFAERINAIARRKATGARRSGAVEPAIVHDATVVIGIAYKDANFGGDTWVFNQSNGCDGNTSTVDFSVVNLNTSPFTCCDFNDNISSFHSFSNCQTVLYENSSFGGAATNGGAQISDMSYVGDAMNDRASSIRWF